MGIRRFRKENLYCMWDDRLEDKLCVCGDSLSIICNKLENNDARARPVKYSQDVSYPFMENDGQIWKFVYILTNDESDDTEDDPVKEAFMHGDTVLRRCNDEEWEEMDERSYFDLPGYEYKLASCVSSRVSNKALAEWLIRGMGLLINAESRRICTSYDFPADELYGEVPSGYKVMPIGSDDWLEPTEDVLQF